jgi:hypothetical protein
MAYLATLTLDDCNSPRMMEFRLNPTGRLDGMPLRIRKGFLTTLGEYLMDRGGDIRYQYIVTDSDFDTVVEMFKQGLPE